MVHAVVSDDLERRGKSQVPLTQTESTVKNTTPISAYTRGYETRLDDVTL